MHTTAHQPLVSNVQANIWRINHYEATQLVAVPGPVQHFTTLEAAGTAASTASVGDALGAVAVLASAHGGFDVAPIAVQAASTVTSTFGDPHLDVDSQPMQPFHFEGDIPDWDSSGPGLGGTHGFYGSATTSAAAGVLGIVDGATSFHVANGLAVAGLLGA